MVFDFICYIRIQVEFIYAYQSRDLKEGRKTADPFKVVKAVEFVDEIPRNPSGKILKRELREMFPKAAPE